MKKILVGAAIGAIALAGVAAAAPANALACGTSALLVNGSPDDGATNELTWYSPTGTVLETIPMGPDQGYGDIALSKDALTVYGVGGDVVDVVDAATGTVKSTFTLTGPAAGVGGWDGAAIRPDGKLIIGSNQSTQVFTVDTATGASTLFFDYTDLPGIIDAYTTGDFATMDNGDEIALGSLDDDSTQYNAIIRIHPDGTGIILGTVNEAWGAGRVDADLQLAGQDGTIRKIALADLPTVAGSSALTETDVVNAGAAESLWGAAGTKDAGTQECVTLPDTGLNTGTALTVGLIAAGLGLAGAASIVIARRKRA